MDIYFTLVVIIILLYLLFIRKKPIKFISYLYFIKKKYFIPFTIIFNSRIKIKLLYNDVLMPIAANDGDAGLDLHLYEDKITVPAKGRKSASTGISIEIPYGHYGRVASRSGNSFNYGIEVGAGIIDSNYRGEIKILLYNHSNKDVIFIKNKRIAQLIIHKILPPLIYKVDKLKSSVRGESGFGSSG